MRTHTHTLFDVVVLTVLYYLLYLYVNAFKGKEPCIVVIVAVCH